MRSETLWRQQTQEAEDRISEAEDRRRDKSTRLWTPYI